MTQNPENPYGKPSEAAPSYAAPAPYDQPGQGAPYGATATDPGKTLAIVSIILPFVGFSLVGLILAIVAKVKSKKAGYKNTLAFASIIVNIVVLVLSIIAIILIIVFFANVANEISEACRNGAESVTINGETVSCQGIS